MADPIPSDDKKETFSPVIPNPLALDLGQCKFDLHAIRTIVYVIQSVLTFSSWYP